MPDDLEALERLGEGDPTGGGFAIFCDHILPERHLAEDCFSFAASELRGEVREAAEGVSGGAPCTISWSPRTLASQ